MAKEEPALPGSANYSAVAMIYTDSKADHIQEAPNVDDSVADVKNRPARSTLLAFSITVLSLNIVHEVSCIDDIVKHSVLVSNSLFIQFFVCNVRIDVFKAFRVAELL